MTDDFDAMVTDSALYAVAIARAIVEPLASARKQGTSGKIALADDRIEDLSQRVAGLVVEHSTKHGEDGVAQLILRLGIMAAVYLEAWTAATDRDPFSELDAREFGDLMFNPDD